MFKKLMFSVILLLYISNATVIPSNRNETITSHLHAREAFQYSTNGKECRVEIERKYINGHTESYVSIYDDIDSGHKWKLISWGSGLKSNKNWESYPIDGHRTLEVIASWEGGSQYGLTGGMMSIQQGAIHNLDMFNNRDYHCSYAEGNIEGGPWGTASCVVSCNLFNW